MSSNLFNLRIFGLTLAAMLGVALILSTDSLLVSATFGCCDTHIDETISVGTDKIPFGTVFPEEVLYKPMEVSLSSSCKADKKIESVEYTIVQKSKAKNSKDASYCATHPTDLTKCYPSLCPYLSKEADNTPPNDTSIPAFHDPSSPSSIAKGMLVLNTDTKDNWVIDLHVPCFKGQCAQDNVVPNDYEANPDLEGKKFACDLNIIVGTTTKVFQEKEGTIGFWKNWNSHKTYTQTQINGWLGTINTASGWLLSEGGYAVSTTGMVALINDANSCNGSLRSCAKKKFLAQYLASQLDLAAGRKILTNSYTLGSSVRTYWGSIANPVTLQTAFTKAESKLPDDGINPTRAQFLLMADAFDLINNTGI